jgi:predicted Zn-dependent protease
MREKQFPPSTRDEWRSPRDVPAAWDQRAFGERLREAIVDWCGLDVDSWCVERVGRICDRLNAARTPAAPLTPVILFVAAPAAFTAPGGYVYVTRGLLHRAWWEEAAALAVAHEMAHHDLGHLHRIAERLAWCRWLLAMAGPLLAVIAGERWLHGPENEFAADARALDLCVAAGYDGRRCLDLFGVFEAYLLDHGDIDGAFGADDRLEEPKHGGAAWMAAARHWAWEHVRGHPAIHARRDALLKRLG